MSENTENTITDTPATSTRVGLDRRGFLGAAGVVSAAAVLAACGSDDEGGGGGGGGTTTEAAQSGKSTTTAGKGDAAADLKTGAFAASLEVLAVNTYKAALDAATADKLGTVPPAVAEFITTVQGHHQSALDSWNKVLTGGGEPEVTDPPADLEKTVNDEFAKVTDVVGAAKLALMLEQIAAATYLKAIPELTTDGAIKLASSIHPIDMQHAAVLLFVLGEYPVPDVFAKTDMAAMPS